MFSKRKFRQNKWVIRISFVFGFVGIFVIACGSEISVAPTIDILPTQTQFSETVTPIFSKTPNPSLTPRPTSTITATPTIDKITVLVSEFNVPAVCLFTYLVSDDQNWIGTNCSLSKELIIANKLAEKKFILQYQEFEKNVPANFSIRPLSWSSDNRYLYFTTRCCDYDDSYNSNGSLYRFDIEKESWGIVVNAIYKPFYFFSDDGERYVYLNHHPLEDENGFEELEIGMVDILSNNSKRVVLKYYWGYDTPEYMWSSDGKQFSIVLHKITAIHYSTIDITTETKEVRLNIDFNRWYMELDE